MISAELVEDRLDWQTKAFQGKAEEEVNLLINRLINGIRLLWGDRSNKIDRQVDWILVMIIAMHLLE